MVFLSPSPMSQIEDRIAAERLAFHVEKSVMDQVAEEKITLPAMPRIASRAFTLLRKKDYSLSEVSALIETDPIVAARLVHLANSVAFATATKLESVLACVTRLGTRELSFFLMETAAKQLTVCHDPRIAQMCDGLWEHSLCVAIVAQDLSEELPGMDPEAAYLSGLLHDLGRPVVAEMLLEAERRLLGSRIDHWMLPSKWFDVIVRCERPVGLALTKAWTLPDTVVEAVSDCDRYEMNRPFRLANVVRMANAIAGLTKHDLAASPLPQLVSVANEGSAILGLEDHVLSRIVSQLPQKLTNRMG